MTAAEQYAHSAPVNRRKVILEAFEAGLIEAARAMCKGCECNAATKEYTFGQNCADIAQTWHVDTGGHQWLKCSAVPIRGRLRGKGHGKG